MTLINNLRSVVCMHTSRVETKFNALLVQNSIEVMSQAARKKNAGTLNHMISVASRYNSDTRLKAFVDTALVLIVQKNRDALVFYIDNLMNTSKDINALIKYFAMKHVSGIVEYLITKNASAESAVEGAILGGYYAYAKTFIEKGVSVEKIKEIFFSKLIALGANKEPIDPHALKFLSHFNADFPPDDLKRWIIPEHIQNRARIISELMNNGDSYSMAFSKTDETCQNRFFLLVVLLMNRGNNQGVFKEFPLDILTHILNFIIPEPLLQNEVECLWFNMKRSCFSAQLLSYHKSIFSKHKDRAESFQKAVNETNNSNELKTLVENQVQILKGNNPYQEKIEKYQCDVKNQTPKKYHELIGLWSKTLTGEDVTFENDTSLLST